MKEESTEKCNQETQLNMLYIKSITRAFLQRRAYSSHLKLKMFAH